MPKEERPPRRIEVTARDEGTRLDALLAIRLGCSRAEARRLLEADAVRVAGRRPHKGERLVAGTELLVHAEVPDAAAKRPVPEPALSLEVLYVDVALVAVNKPPGQPSHPLRPGERGTLAGALVARHPECALASPDPREGGLCHRLDVETSGVLLAARTPAIHARVRQAFAGGQVEKEYWALVSGEPPREAVVDAPLLSPRGAGRVRVDMLGRPAETRLEVLARGAGVALMRAVTRSGRMHQIRAHLAHLGHPLVGDRLYGGPPALPGAPGHFLHAARVTLPHPESGRPLTVVAPLPPDRAVALAREVGPLPR